jgi:hypothetical protein
MDTTRPTSYRSNEDGLTRHSPGVIEKCLNHVEQNRVLRIYQRQKLEVEQAEAWRVLGDRLELLAQKDTGKVIAATFIEQLLVGTYRKYWLR